jgi:hypothetical protein
LTADTNRESASVAYATIVKSMADYPLGPSTHLLAASRLRSAHPTAFAQHLARHKHALAYSLTAPVIAET